MKKVVYFLFSIISIGLFADSTENAVRQVSCRPFAARMQVEFTQTNCSSPVGICTKGQIVGDSVLRGNTFYTVEHVAGAAGDPSMSEAMVYAGTLRIQHPGGGEFTIKDLGTFDKTTGLISSQSRSLTGEWKQYKVSGVFFTAGKATSNGNGFQSSAFGEVCLQKKSD